MHAVELPAACENCRATLHGAYCHACGQQAANPLRSFHHAVEDVFGSFWHLDGRVFRTLRELFVPGRVACNYLAGQRVRYVPPLRLFVVLTVITFFIGQFAVGLGARNAPVTAAPGPAPAASGVQAGAQPRQFEQARSEAEVQRLLARELAELREAREAVAFVPGSEAGLDEIEQQLRDAAQQRIATLRAASTCSTAGTPAPAPAAAIATDGSAAAARDDGDSSVSAAALDITGGRLREASRPWHEHDNPLDVGWLPAFGDRWLNHRLANAERNLERIDETGESALAALALAAVPSALFVLVPVFALLLRIIHIGTPRGYLEHLVVALYSHALMLLVLLGGFMLVIAGALLPSSGFDAALGAVQAALWLSVPVYLFVMQKRVYRQHWLITAGKYLLLGGAYFMLVAAAVVYTALAGLTSGG